jgi:hypothetical protein
MGSLMITIVKINRQELNMKKISMMILSLCIVVLFVGCSQSSKKRYENLVKESKGFENFAKEFKQFDGSLLMNMLYLKDFDDKKVDKFQKRVKYYIRYYYPVCMYDSIVSKYNKNDLRRFFNDEEALDNYEIAKKKYNISINKLIMDMMSSSSSCAAQVIEKFKKSYEDIFHE